MLIALLQAFTMIDQNRDGVIDIEDLKDMYSNLGMSHCLFNLLCYLLCVESEAFGMRFCGCSSGMLLQYSTMVLKTTFMAGYMLKYATISVPISLPRKLAFSFLLSLLPCFLQGKPCFHVSSLSLRQRLS